MRTFKAKTMLYTDFNTKPRDDALAALDFVNIRILHVPFARSVT